MPHQVRHDIWAGGWGKQGVAGRRLSPAVRVAEDPGDSIGRSTLSWVTLDRGWSEGEPSPSPKNLPVLQNFFDIRAAEVGFFVQGDGNSA